MSACEVCWDLAFIRSRATGRPQAECYREILRENEGDPSHVPTDPTGAQITGATDG